MSIKTPAIRKDSYIHDADGKLICECHKGTGEEILHCINQHPVLTARIAELETLKEGK